MVLDLPFFFFLYCCCSFYRIPLTRAYTPTPLYNVLYLSGVTCLLICNDLIYYLNVCAMWPFLWKPFIFMVVTTRLPNLLNWKQILSFSLLYTHTHTHTTEIYHFCYYYCSFSSLKKKKFVNFFVINNFVSWHFFFWLSFSSFFVYFFYYSVLYVRYYVTLYTYILVFSVWRVPPRPPLWHFE